MSKEETKPGAATALRNQALAGLEFFHSPEQAAFVTFSDGVTDKVNSERMRHWLRQKSGKSPSMNTLQAAIDDLAGKAVYDRPEHEVFVRLGWGDSGLYLDLGPMEGKKQEYVKVSVDEDGRGRWELASSVPVKFRRPSTLKPLPTPTRGGNLEQLRELINVRNGDDWILLKAWLVGALCPGGIYPILAFHGVAGAGKSCASRYLRSLVDPSGLDTTRAPEKIETLNIRALKTWIVAFDNVSSMKQDLSDALCRMVTGAGDSTRKLYTDDDETIFRYKRPAILNGITEYATQGDLLSRIISVTLETIWDTRRTEKQLDRQFEEARPAILGSLLDHAARALAENQDTDEYVGGGRLADFAQWVAASGICERDRFFRVLERNQNSAERIAIEASDVGIAVVKFMENRDSWDGTATDLLKKLESTLPTSGYENSHIEKPRYWPALPKTLADQLMKVAPALGKVEGIIVGRESSHDHENKTRYTLVKQAINQSRPEEEYVPTPEYDEEGYVPVEYPEEMATAETPPNQQAAGQALTDEQEERRKLEYIYFDHHGHHIRYDMRPKDFAAYVGLHYGLGWETAWKEVADFVRSYRDYEEILRRLDQKWVYFRPNVDHDDGSLLRGRDQEPVLLEKEAA